jgi:hypothetical protein
VESVNPEQDFDLYLESWPQADFQLGPRRPLALARQDIALRLAKSAAEQGGSPFFLAESAAAASHTSAASDGRAWGNRTPVADILAGLSPFAQGIAATPQAVFPTAAGTLFRLMTGGDLALLATHAPQTLADEFVQLPSAVIRANVSAVTECMAQRSAELAVVGDPGAAGWKHLERETACRVRLLADSSGGLLAALLQSVGPRRFVAYLGELGDAALLNTRMLFRANDYPSANDFFWSDMGKTEWIVHATLQALTEHLLASNQAVILGGDSLMSGGIYLLIEKAWESRELPRQVSILNAPS